MHVKESLCEYGQLLMCFGFFCEQNTETVTIREIKVIS